MICQVLFGVKVLKSGEIMEKLDTSFNSANRLIKSLVDLNLLDEITGFSRNRLFVLWKYLDLFNK